MWSGGSKNQITLEWRERREEEMGVPPGSSPVRRRRRSRGGRIQDRIFVFIVLKVKRFDCVQVHILMVRSQWRGKVNISEKTKLSCSSSRQPTDLNGL